MQAREGTSHGPSDHKPLFVSLVEAVEASRKLRAVPTAADRATHVVQDMMRVMCSMLESGTQGVQEVITTMRSLQKELQEQQAVSHFRSGCGAGGGLGED